MKIGYTAIKIKGQKMRRKPVGNDCIFFSQWTNSKATEKQFIPLSWDNAERQCMAYSDPNRGSGHLLGLGSGDNCKARYYGLIIMGSLIHNNSYFRSLWAFAARQNETNIVYDYVWIGLRYNKTTQVFQWSDGAWFMEDNWDIGQPKLNTSATGLNNQTAIQLSVKETLCVAISKRTLKWTMMACSIPLPYVCLHRTNPPKSFPAKV